MKAEGQERVKLIAELQQARNEIARLNGQTQFICKCGGTKVELQQAREEIEIRTAAWSKENDIVVSLQSQLSQVLKDKEFAEIEQRRWAEAHTDLQAAHDANCRIVAKLTEQLSEANEQFQEVAAHTVDTEKQLSQWQECAREINTLNRAMQNDHIKYPQLKLPKMQSKRLNQALSLYTQLTQEQKEKT